MRDGGIVVKRGSDVGPHRRIRLHVLDGIELDSYREG